MDFFNRLEEAKSTNQAVFVGYDPLEDKAAKMFASSIRRKTSQNVKIIPIINAPLMRLLV